MRQNIKHDVCYMPKQFIFRIQYVYCLHKRTQLTMIDLLIDWLLLNVQRVQYLSYIQDENKFNIMQKLYGNGTTITQELSFTLTCY
jgi:hypothetical protein